MSILQKLKERQSTFSLEFFPPKKDMPVTLVYDAIEKLSQYNPAFVSVTYGAGGSNTKRTIEVVSHIKDTYGLETIAHLTCVGADPYDIKDVLSKLEDRGIYNVLALRGDIPDDMNKKNAFAHYKHASDLISDIKKRGGYTIGAAAYPEGHVESMSLDKDIDLLRLKAQAGADFFIAQLCFDKYAIECFYEKLEKAGITVPTLTGIMPVLNPKQIIRMSLLSACSIPAPLSKIICLYGENADDFRKAGLEYAVDQINYLMNIGLNKFHLYTMNKADAIKQIIEDSNLT